MSHRIWICLTTIVVCVVLALTFPVRTDSIWIDPVSGSAKFQTSWLYVPVRTRIEQSELERWIIAHEGFHKAHWGFMNATDRLISGRVASRACRSWPIGQFPAGELNTLLVHNATDEEIAEFVRIMRYGTRDEQTQAVEEAVKILERAYSRAAATARTGAVGRQSPAPAIAIGNDGATAVLSDATSSER